MLRKADPGKYPPENGADYGKTASGKACSKSGSYSKRISEQKCSLWIAEAGTITSMKAARKCNFRIC